jgi:Protein of unknown function (DUF3054)
MSHHYRYSDCGSRIGALVAVLLSLLLLLVDTGILAFAPPSSSSARAASVAAFVSLTSVIPPPLAPGSRSRLTVLATSPLPTDQQQQPEASLIAATSTTSTTDKDATAMSSISFSSTLLGLVDLAMFFVFAAMGRASHVDGSSLDVMATLYTAAPFVAAWFFTAPWTGVYQENPHGKLPVVVATTASYSDVAVAAALQALRGWVVAMPLGCVIRGVVKGYVPPLPFVLVTLVATFVLLSAARVMYAVTARYLQQSYTTSSPSINEPRD